MAFDSAVTRKLKENDMSFSFLTRTGIFPHSSGGRDRIGVLGGGEPPLLPYGCPAERRGGYE